MEVLVLLAKETLPSMSGEWRVAQLLLGGNQPGEKRHCEDHICIDLEDGGWQQDRKSQHILQGGVIILRLQHEGILGHAGASFKFRKCLSVQGSLLSSCPVSAEESES